MLLRGAHLLQLLHGFYSNVLARVEEVLVLLDDLEIRCLLRLLLYYGRLDVRLLVKLILLNGCVRLDVLFAVRFKVALLSEWRVVVC